MCVACYIVNHIIMYPCTASLGHLRLMFNTALSDAWIWVLLTRHVVNTKQASDYISLRIELEEGTPIPSTGLSSEQVLAKDVSNDLDVVDFTESACRERLQMESIFW